MLTGTVEDYARLYREYRATHPGSFTGILSALEVQMIARLVAKHEPTRLLDYGSGAGHQYLVYRQHDAWGGLLPHCYDPGIVGMDTEPAGTFGGVICTDVLEHISAQDLPAVLDHLAAFVEPGGFVYLKIQCLPAKKTFDCGRNVHLTVRSPEWWDKFLHLWLTAGRNLKLSTTYEGAEAWHQ